MKVVMFCGGVGGARGALALYENLPKSDLTFVVNTGDDFRHLNLEIWPDWDTVVYHLAGLEERQRGWGRADEGTRIMEELTRLRAPDWFHLGDRDVALHLYRSWFLAQGGTRQQLAQRVCEGFGIDSTVLPLTKASCPTKLILQSGQSMDFQEWFVEHRGEPEVREVHHAGPCDLVLTGGIQERLEDCDLVLMAPSNPYLSLGPMLAQKNLQRVLKSLNVPKLAISPLIGGKAIKGPLDALINTLSKSRGQQAIADYWETWVDRLLLPGDEIEGLETSLELVGCSTWLKRPEDRASFAQALVKICEALV